MKPTQFIIFGASGNLTANKLLPALYNLAVREKFPTEFEIIGVARKDWSVLEFRIYVHDALQKALGASFDESFWESVFENHISYVQGDFADSTTYTNLHKELSTTDKKIGSPTEKVFYLAVPPESYLAILNGLKDSTLCMECHASNSKLVIEKPFGSDYESAVELNTQISHVFSEQQIYRIDHILGKDTLEDVLSFRQNNTIINSLISADLLDHIQVSYLEEIGIEGRGNFFEKTGIIRDMVQSHILELLAVATMDFPLTNDLASIARLRTKVISSIETPTPENIVLGQYKSYAKETDVHAGSKVPTFVAFKTRFTEGKLKDVPLYIRTGKNLKQKFTEILFVFKKTLEQNNTMPNILAFRLQPQSGVFMNLSKRNIDIPEQNEQVALEFCYKDSEKAPRDGYENLLYQLLNNNRSSFVTMEEVLAGWKFADPLVKYSTTSEANPTIYSEGTYGPEASSTLMSRDKREWYTDKFLLICKI